MLLRVLRQPSAFSVLRQSLSYAAVVHKQIEVKDHYDFDKKVRLYIHHKFHYSPLLSLQVVNNDNPVIVNFHAEWCDPCKILTPKLEELLSDSPDIDLAILDVESHVDLVHTFEVKAVPAVLCFRNGVVVDKFIGLVDATMIDTMIEKLKKKKIQE